jgi:hypothetical protein
MMTRGCLSSAQTAAAMMGLAAGYRHRRLNKAPHEGVKCMELVCCASLLLLLLLLLHKGVKCMELV